MCSRIPKANRPPIGGHTIPPHFIPMTEKVTFSFSALEKTKHFNLDATCPNWSSELFEMLRNVSNYSKTELISGRLRTYRVHNHETAHPPDPLPDGVALKDCYQIRISKSKGGIHGVFNENVFYVIWLDPLHNMYPDDRYGGLKVITPPKTCCMDRNEALEELKRENAQLKEDCEFWEKEAQEAEAAAKNRETK